MKIKLGLILPTVALLITFFSGCSIDSTESIEYSLTGDISACAGITIVYAGAAQEPLGDFVLSLPWSDTVYPAVGDPLSLLATAFCVADTAVTGTISGVNSDGSLSVLTTDTVSVTGSGGDTSLDLSILSIMPL